MESTTTIIIGFLALIVIVVGIYSMVSSMNCRSKSIKLLKKKSNTICSRNVMTSEDGKNAFGIDEVNKKILFKNSNEEIFEYNFRDLYDYELLIDEKRIKPSTKAPVIGAMVGQAIAGTPGLIFGAVASISNEKIKVKSIKFQFHFNTSVSQQSITFFDGGILSFDSDKEPVKSKLIATKKWIEKLYNISSQK